MSQPANLNDADAYLTPTVCDTLEKVYGSQVPDHGQKYGEDFMAEIIEPLARQLNELQSPEKKSVPGTGMTPKPTRGWLYGVGALTIVALLAAASAFAWLVWPTPYRHDHYEAIPIRIHRITGEAERLIPTVGWEPITPTHGKRLGASNLKAQQPAQQASDLADDIRERVRQRLAERQIQQQFQRPRRATPVGDTPVDMLAQESGRPDEQQHSTPTEQNQSTTMQPSAGVLSGIGIGTFVMLTFAGAVLTRQRREQTNDGNGEVEPATKSRWSMIHLAPLISLWLGHAAVSHIGTAVPDGQPWTLSMASALGEGAIYALMPWCLMTPFIHYFRTGRFRGTDTAALLIASGIGLACRGLWLMMQAG